MRVVAAMVVAAISGCTDVELCAAPCTAVPEQQADSIVEVTGTACTIDPQAVLFPYKILFVIDVSGSNRDSDPADNRARAVREVIDTYIENRSVEFGVISFNDTPEAQTPEFTRDLAVLVPDVVGALTTKVGGTNYLDTLSLAERFIEDDILATPEGERSRTRYDIQWVSDGIPDPCARPATIIEATRQVMDLRDRYGLFDLSLSTIKLAYPGGGYAVLGCEDVGPEHYLAPMAEVGRGDYREMTSGELAFDIGFTELYRAFETREFFLVNENRELWDGAVWADSDGDGLRDLAEHEPDPLAGDYNADGCSDRVDEEMLPNLGLCADICAHDMLTADPSTLPDLDGDALPDCAEKVLGYSPTSSDTDLDGFPDLIELKQRSGALDEQPYTTDSDNDGVSDGEELRTGTNPRFPESETARRLHGYLYSPLYPVASAVPGTSCFEFSIDNVRLAATRATPDAPEGTNRLCVYMVQTSVDDPDAEPTVTRACKPARYFVRGGIDVKEPALGVVEITPSDFSLATAPQ